MFQKHVRWGFGYMYIVSQKSCLVYSEIVKSISTPHMLLCKNVSYPHAWVERYYLCTCMCMCVCACTCSHFYPWRASAARVTVLGLLFCPSVHLSVTTFSANTHNKAAKKRYQRVQCHIWLDFKNGNFHKSTAFKSYGVKTKPTSQYANKRGLPRPDSARFEHTEGSRSNTKGEYVVLVCQKHYL